MYKNQFLLLTTRRFLPLFITQFLGAFNDNFYKNALVVLVVYFMPHLSPKYSNMLVVLAGGLLILPMVLFSAQAGSLADKFEKSKLIRIIKLAEIIIMMVGAWALITQNIFLLMSVLFFLGVQMTFFGPLKYSILPTQLQEDELIGGNALIEMATFMAILLGYILSIIIINLPYGFFIVSGMMIAVAIGGYLSSWAIPSSAAASPELTLSVNFVKETIHLIQVSRKSPDLFFCMIGISWFWLLGFVFLTLFPNFAKDIIRGNNQIYLLFLTTFSIGIALGSGICNRMLKGRVKATFVPWAALGISLFIVDLFFSSLREVNMAHALTLMGPKEYFDTFNHWRMIIDLLWIAFCGGIYIVPLYTLLQYRSNDKFKARMIASNNIMNALFMIVAAVAMEVMLKFNFTIPHIFISVGIINLFVGLQICKLLKINR